MVATSQPKPWTFAFWGFGMLGLLVGYVFTYPMNWMMVKIGWKHGMGGMKAALEKQVKGAPGRFGLLTAMSVLGGVALLLPAWLTKVRQDAGRLGNDEVLNVGPHVEVGAALFDGLCSSLGHAIEGLTLRQRKKAALAMDDALRAAEAGAHSAPGSFYSALELIRDSRLALQQGNASKALAYLGAASAVIHPATEAKPPFLDVRRYNGAQVIDSEGAIIGEVANVSGKSVELALGGWRDAWGFIDFGTRQHVRISSDSLAFGPPRAIGMRLVMVATSNRPIALR